MAELILLLVYIAFAIFLIVEPDLVGRAIGRGRNEDIDGPRARLTVRVVGCVMLAAVPGTVVGIRFAWWTGALLVIAIALVLFALANRVLRD